MTPLEWMLFIAGPYVVFGFALGINFFTRREPRA